MSEDKEIKIEYSKSDGFFYLPATGAYGGPNPQGEIICNFFVEYRKIPEEAKVVVDAKTGKIKKEVAKKETDTIFRELQVGICMRPDIARSVGEFLIREADKIIFKTPDESPKT